MPKVKKSRKANKRILLRDVPLSDDSLTKESRIGVSSNYVSFSKISDDEVVLSFIKITTDEVNKIYKDLACRVTMSLNNAIALKELLNKNIKK